jgi:adenosylcobinamide-phosphate synthase
MSNLGLIACALVLEAVAGYPEAWLRAIGHPVIWIGALISRLDRAWNRDALGDAVRRRRGVAAVLVLIVCSAAPAAILQAALAATLPPTLSLLLTAAVASTLLAQRSLWSFVAAVGQALRVDGLPAGRAAVAHIVGRNPETLDEPAVLRAAIESLAENFSDGVVAPALWGALLGLPGITAYKALNTADSMIGHLTPRHREFGWASARLDDLVNLPASRLAAAWLVLAAFLHPGASASGALRATWRDAGRHRSPNAGWPEAAMAGALGLRLAGPRVYGDLRVDDAWMGNGRMEAEPRDLDRALALYRTACVLQIAAVLLLWAATLRG